MVLDLNNPVHRIRLEIGDTQDVPIYPDSVYQSIYDGNNQDMAKSVLDSAYAILAILSQRTRERLDRIEYYGNQSYEQYLTFIQEKIAQLEGRKSVARNMNVYAGGLFISDMASNLNNTDINHVVSVMDSDTMPESEWGW